MADFPIAVGAGALTLTGETPVLFASANVMVGNIVMPLFVLEAAIDQGLTLPFYDVEATVMTGGTTNVFQTPLALPFYTVAATITVGTAITANITMPLLELYASDGTQAVMTLPMFVVEATGVLGVVGTASATMPLFEVYAEGQHTLSAGVITMPLFSVESVLVTGSLGNGAISIPMFDVAATGVIGVVGTADLTLSLFEVVSAIYAAVTGTADVRIPLFVVRAEGFSAFAEVFKAWAINIETAALTEYQGYNYNSFANVDGRYFAASASGIFELTGDDDNGTAIDATMVFKNDNFGDSRMSRVIGAYVSADVSDDMRFGLNTNGYEYVYEMAVNGQRGMVSRRIDTVKGEKAIYWQANLTNVGGADFSISAIEPLAKKLGRRI